MKNKTENWPQIGGDEGDMTTKMSYGILDQLRQQKSLIAEKLVQSE